MRSFRFWTQQIIGKNGRERLLPSYLRSKLGTGNEMVAQEELGFQTVNRKTQAGNMQRTGTNVTSVRT